MIMLVLGMVWVLSWVYVSRSRVELGLLGLELGLWLLGLE